MKTSLPASIVSSLREVVDADWNVIAYSIEGHVDVDEVEAAIDIIDECMAPLDPRSVGELLAELFVLTKRRREDKITLDLAIEAYGSRLLEYPADIVHTVIKVWPNQSTWWPSWHELKSEIDWRNDRSKMRSALQAKLNPDDNVQGVVVQAIRRM
jgi:hypothetical protein